MNDDSKRRAYDELARYIKRYRELHRNIEALENMLKEARNHGNLKILNNTGENISNGINNRFYRAYMPPSKHTIVQPKWTEVNNLLKRYPIAIMHGEARKGDMLRYLGKPMRRGITTGKPIFENRSYRMFDPSMKYTKRSLKERMLNRNYQMTENNRRIKELLLMRSKL